MIKVEFISPLYEDRQVFPSLVAQPIRPGDLVKSRSGADFKVKAIYHTSRMISSPSDSNVWHEEPIVLVELMEK